MSVHASNLRVVRGGRALLDGVDLHAGPGQVTAVVGPNGAGKSTLLRVLSGDLSPDEGGVDILDTPLPSWAPRALARRRAVLPQRSTLTFPFPLAEVVRMGRLPWNEPARRTDEVVAEVLQQLALDPLAQRTWTTLSGGEQQRGQLGRVLAQLWSVEDAIMLLDEPTNHLDLTHQVEVLRTARRRADRGNTVICVLHDLNLAARVADVVVVLDRGRVVARGAPGQVLDPALLARVWGVHGVQIPHPTGGPGLLFPVVEAACGG